MDRSPLYISLSLSLHPSSYLLLSLYPFTHLAIYPLSLYPSIYLALYYLYISIYLSYPCVSPTPHTHTHKAPPCLWLSFLNPTTSICGNTILSFEDIFFLFMHLSIPVSPVPLSLYPCISSPSIYLSIYLSVPLSIYLTACLGVCMSIYLSPALPPVSDVESYDIYQRRHKLILWRLSLRFFFFFFFVVSLSLSIHLSIYHSLSPLYLRPRLLKSYDFHQRRHISLSLWRHPLRSCRQFKKIKGTLPDRQKRGGGWGPSPWQQRSHSDRALIGLRLREPILRPNQSRRTASLIFAVS